MNKMTTAACALALGSPGRPPPQIAQTTTTQAEQKAEQIEQKAEQKADKIEDKADRTPRSPQGRPKADKVRGKARRHHRRQGGPRLGQDQGQDPAK